MRKAALAAMMAAWPTAARRGSSTPRGWGRMCDGCGWPEADCQCSGKAATESIPTRIVAKLQNGKKGRGGKTVTVVDNLPNSSAFLKELCRGFELRSYQAAPSRMAPSSFRGIFAIAVRARLTARGMTVKG